MKGVNKMGRFVVIVLDGFGIGAMDDVKEVRPKDLGSNTCAHIFEKKSELMLPNLAEMGLANALGMEFKGLPYGGKSVFGKAKLMHDGADTFFGHQEIMGTRPKRPYEGPIKKDLEAIEKLLLENDYQVRRYIGEQESFLIINECVTVADNIECDPGLAYNVTGSLDDIPFEEQLKIGKLVRSIAKVPRVITFSGRGIHLPNLLEAVEEKGEYIGVNAPKSGVYDNDYHCIHLGYGVDPTVQAPTILGKKNIPVYLLGKVADVVQNPYGVSIPMVDTKEVLEKTSEILDTIENGFICVNVQETDLSGHGQDVDKYANKLCIADQVIGEIRQKLKEDDILLVMADHGNDPTIGHPQHTRECVPILIDTKKAQKKNIGIRNTLSDVGATVCEYFSVPSPENGKSFLKEIK